MPIMRQEILFGIQDLYDLEPTRRFEAIFSTLTIEPVLADVSKQSIYGAPTELNYAAMIYAVKRVNAYLKEFFQLKNVRYRSGKRAKVHFDLVTLVYNASKLAVDRISQKMREMNQAA